MATVPAEQRTGCRSYLIIPARLASTRLPRKLLLRETGKSVLQHTGGVVLNRLIFAVHLPAARVLLLNACVP